MPSGWRVLKESVQGASHIRVGKPNQDAIESSQKTNGVLPIILAVSDGHGSSKCFRSEIGSKLAVDCAISVSDEFLQNAAQLNLSHIRDSAQRLLTVDILQKWARAVEDHLTTHPFTDSELETLSNEVDPSAVAAVKENGGLLAYGATLLLVIVATKFIMYLQLGDGDIVAVNSDGVAERVLEEDSSLIANETTSLCQKNAAKKFRFRFQEALQNLPPKLILASTDGYFNSFSSEAGFLQVGVDLLKIASADGLEKITTELEGWLAQASSEGSGDDVSLGLIIQA